MIASSLLSRPVTPPIAAASTALGARCESANGRSRKRKPAIDAEITSKRQWLISRFSAKSGTPSSLIH